MSDRMNPVEKAEWVAALRSGEYEQGKGRLRTGNKFCCLGVRLDKACDGEWLSAYEDRPDLFVWKHKADYAEGGVLPWQYALPAFGGVTGRFYVDGEAHSLTELNDEGFTFEQIADVVDYFW